MSIFRRRPMVSVILAAYNHETMVEEAVRSVLGQSMGDLELIIVDDASTDRTAEVIAAIKDSRIRFFRNRRNRERHPRNFALSLARGRWVAFQNSDDVWMESKLSAQLALLAKRPKLSVVFSDVALIKGDGDVLPGRGPFLDPAEQPDSAASGWLRRFLLHHNCVAIASALIRRRDLLRAGGMDPQLRQFSDFDLWIRLAAMGGCALHPEMLTKVRVYEDHSNMSAPRPDVMRRNFWEIARVMRRFFEDNCLKRLPSILPELNLGKKTGLLERKVALGRYLMEHPLPAYRLTAEWLWSNLIENEEAKLEKAGLRIEVIDRLIALRGAMHPPVME